MLGAAHTPDHTARPVVGEAFSDIVHLGFGDTGDFFYNAGREVGDFSAYFIHTVNALIDVLVVFPAIFKNVP